MSGRPPRVTAVVPAYRSAGFIGATLDSLAAQTWGNLEILVGDDASPDATAEVIRSFAARHPNVRAVLRTRNLGWMANTNDLMQQATGEFRFFMPHDDRIEPTYVERLVGALRETPGAAIAYSDVSFATLGEEPKVHAFDALGGPGSRVSRARRFMTMPENWWVPHRGIFRAEAYRAVGGLRPAPFIGQVSADFTWLFGMALAGGFVRVPEVLYHKVWMPASLSRNWRHGTDQKRALLLAAAQATWRASIPEADRAAVLTLLAAYGSAREVYLLPRKLRRRLGRAAA